MVIVNFIRDYNVGMYARVKRKEKGAPLVWDGGRITLAGEKTAKVVEEALERDSD